VSAAPSPSPEATAPIEADALLFDNDGTLVDTTAAVDRAWHDFAVRYGVDPEEVLAVAHGVRADETIRRFLPDGDRAAAARWLDARELELVHETVALPGARDAADPPDRAGRAVGDRDVGSPTAHREAETAKAHRG